MNDTKETMRVLTHEEIKHFMSIKLSSSDSRVAIARFLHDGRNVNIVTGQKMKKGTNVINQYCYWNWTREDILAIAKLTGTKAVFSKDN